MYIFDKSNCTHPFDAMIHGLAIFAALTSCRQFSFVPDEPVSTELIAVREARTHLYMALAPHAMKVGEKVDALDYEHLQQALAILSLLLMVPHPGARKETFPEFWAGMGRNMMGAGDSPELIAQCAWHAGIAGGR